MEAEFADGKLDRLETDPKYTAGFGPDVSSGRSGRPCRRSAPRRMKEDFYALKFLHFEKRKRCAFTPTFDPPQQTVALNFLRSRERRQKRQ